MKKVKIKEHEKLTPANIERVISLMNASPPITKKAACEILNIAYNTTRLAKIIEEYQVEKAYTAERRAKNRGKPASDHEIQVVVEQYLGGDGVTEIAGRLYRPTSFVSDIIERIGVPTRPTGDLRYVEALIPEECVAEEFEVGQIVWSAKYHAPAKVITEITLDYLKKSPGLEQRDYLKEDGSRMYLVWVTERVGDELPARFANVSVGGHYTYAFAYKLGSLEHLKALGINLERL